MRLFHQLAALWRSLFRNSQTDADLSEEMRFHVECVTQQNISRGMAPDEARRAARLSFGSMDARQEQSRDERPGAGLRRMLQDLRFGVRLLGKAPVFAITGVAIVALGVGAATAIFSVVHGVMLRPLPFREPQQLVNIWINWPTGIGRTSPAAADVMELRQLAGTFEDIAYLRNLNLSLGGDVEPRRLLGATASANIFSALGVSAAIGRTFAPNEDQAGNERVVVLSDALWRGHFAADSAIVGRLVRINGSDYAVIGVLPPGVHLPWRLHEAWIPNVLDPRELVRERNQNYRVVARLRDGTSIDRARGDASALAERMGASVGARKGAGLVVEGTLDDTVSEVRLTLKLLLGAVSLLVLIACVNLANLFGARASARRGEFAVRLALGASRRRLVGQAIAEAAPVLLLGGVMGVALAFWAVNAFVSAAPEGIPRLEGVAVSAPVMAYSLALLAVAGLAASIAPAVQAWTADFTTTTKDGGRSSTGGRARMLARRGGVAAQFALAIPLLVGASLLMRSAINVMRVDLGFSPDGVATVSFDVSRAKHVSNDDVINYYARLVEAARAVPGVAQAGIVNKIPLFDEQTASVMFEGARNLSSPSDTMVDISNRIATPDYFATMGIKLVAGRDFSDRDDAAAPPVAIIDEAVARASWPGETAVGKRVRRGGSESWATIVGVVKQIRTVAVDLDPRPQVYWSYRQQTQGRAVLAARGEVEPGSLLQPLVRAIRSVDPDQAVYDLRTMSEIVDRSLAQRRMTTFLIVSFGVAALLLAAVGIYGNVAYGVTQRMREFGIRVALGAGRGDVARLVVWQGTAIALAGAAIGLALAVAAAGVTSTLVYGVAPRDAASLIGATALLTLVAVVASYIPARRAAGVDPGITLRAE